MVLIYGMRLLLFWLIVDVDQLFQNFYFSFCSRPNRIAFCIFFICLLWVWLILDSIASSVHFVSSHCLYSDVHHPTFIILFTMCLYLLIVIVVAVYFSSHFHSLEIGVKFICSRENMIGFEQFNNDLESFLHLFIK